MAKSVTETIDKIGIKYGEHLHFVVSVGGGSQELTPLPGYIEVTSAPCAISYDDDTTVKRAKMPCKCVIGGKAKYNPSNFCYSSMHCNINCEKCMEI